MVTLVQETEGSFQVVVSGRLETNIQIVLEITGVLLVVVWDNEYNIIKYV